jgi:hypothetical protein
MQETIDWISVVDRQPVAGQVFLADAHFADGDRYVGLCKQRENGDWWTHPFRHPISVKIAWAVVPEGIARTEKQQRDIDFFYDTDPVRKTE